MNTSYPSIQEILDSREQALAQIKSEIMSIVLEKYEIIESKPSKVRRGPLVQMVYNKLGFHGKNGNHFCSFMNKLMAEQGFRPGISTGWLVYHGLRLKDQSLHLPIDTEQNNDNHAN